MLPREFFFKMVQFGVYFDQIIMSLKIFKNTIFYVKILKIGNFLYERINILDTRLLWGIIIILMKKFFEKFMIDAF